MTDELKPCPFCGGSAIYRMDHTTENCDSVWCDKCDCRVSDFNLDKQGDCIAAWNTRTPTPAEAMKELQRLGQEYDAAPTNPVVSQDAPDLGHKAAPQEDASEFSIETFVAQMEAAILGGANFTVNYSNPAHGAWHIENSDVVEALAYLRATSDARIAELQAERDEDANQLDSARHTVDVLTARIATARNEALEKLAVHFDGQSTVAGYYIPDEIRALKTPEGDG